MVLLSISGKEVFVFYELPIELYAGPKLILLLLLGLLRVKVYE